jgi:hypothetical protein
MEEARRRAMLAEALAQQQYEPMEGNAAPIPKAAPLVKALQGFMTARAGRQAQEAAEEAKGMEADYAQRMLGRMQGGYSYQPDAELEAQMAKRPEETLDQYTQRMQATPFVGRATPVPEQTELGEVTRQSQYRRAPEEVLNMASTGLGAAALKDRPVMAARLAQMLETPKEAEYGTTPQFDAEGRAFVVNKAGNVRYLDGVKAPAAAPAAVTPTTIMRNGKKVVVDARTGAEIGLAPTDAPAGPKESAEGLRKEFTSQTSQYRGVSDAFQKIKSAALNPSAANDLSLIFGYMRALDPASTVREGEFANAQNAGGIDATIRNLYNKVASGERLTQAQRQDFLQSAYGLVESQIPNVQQTIDRYTAIAGRSGLNPEDIVSDPFASVRIPRLQGDNDPMFEKLKSGDLFIAPNGKIMRKR